MTKQPEDRGMNDKSTNVQQQQGNKTGQTGQQQQSNPGQGQQGNTGAGQSGQSPHKGSNR